MSNEEIPCHTGGGGRFLFASAYILEKYWTRVEFEEAFNVANVI